MAHMRPKVTVNMKKTEKAIHALSLLIAIDQGLEPFTTTPTNIGALRAWCIKELRLWITEANDNFEQVQEHLERSE